MREIKFRAWNSSWKMMIQPQDIISLGSDGVSNKIADVRFWIKTTDGVHHDHTWEDDEDVILMQYTGLKDKNGKEIYEGDIVQYKDWKDNYGDTPVEVDFINGQFSINHHATKEYDEWWSECEIIGNRFENPELLAN